MCWCVGLALWAINVVLPVQMDRIWSQIEDEAPSYDPVASKKKLIFSNVQKGVLCMKENENPTK